MEQKITEHFIPSNFIRCYGNSIKNDINMGKRKRMYY